MQNFPKLLETIHKYFMHMFRAGPEILWTINNLLMVYINLLK